MNSSGLRPVQQPQEDDDHEEESWWDSNDYCCDCDCPDKPPSHGPVTITPFDRQLWESLLDYNWDTQRWQHDASNGSNNRWVGATYEEVIPPSVTTSELSSAQYVQAENGASLRRQLTLSRTIGSIGGRTQTISESSASRPTRVVNWPAEACDSRWGKLAQATDLFGNKNPNDSQATKQDELRKTRLVFKRLPQSVELGMRPKSLFYVPVRSGVVNGVELFLSSAVDSMQSPQSGVPNQSRGSNQQQPQTDLRQPKDPRPLPHANSTILWPSQLLGAKTATAGNPGLLKGPTPYRIPSSEAVWLSANLRWPTGTSEVTMDISGDSLSPDSEDVEEEPLPQQPREAVRLPEGDRLSFGLAVDWRKVVSISVINGGGPATTAAATAAPARLAEDVTTLAPLSFSNSMTTSTNTEQSASTTVVGHYDCQNVQEARSAMPEHIAMQRQGDATAALVYRKRRPSLIHRGEPQESLALLRQPRPQIARMLVRHSAVSLAAVWLVCGNPLVPESVYVASLWLHCLDNSQFVWQARQPPRCSHASSQMLLGPLDISQSSENQLTLQRIPVYVHRRSVDAIASVTSVIGQTSQLCVSVTAPEFLSALRYVMPSQVSDWLPSEASNSPKAKHLPPLELRWSQRINWISQPTNSAGLQFPSARASCSNAPVRPIMFQVAASVSETSAAGAGTATPWVARKNQDLQVLRRTVKMKMQRRIQGDEFVGVACNCCSCCSSSLNVEAIAGAGRVSKAAAVTDEEDRKSNLDPLKQSLDGLMESLRSCRLSATFAALEQREQRCRPSDRHLVGVIERILQESTSQQAALKDLLASLQKAPPPPGDEQQNSGTEVPDKVLDEEVERSTKTQSDQFYSLHTGVAGQLEIGTMASIRTADAFRSPGEATHAIGGFGAETANNNAEVSPATKTSSLSSAGSARHSICSPLAYPEESADLLMHEETSWTCSLVSNCSAVHHQDSRSSTSSRGSILVPVVTHSSSLVTAGTVRQAAQTAACRQNLSRFRVLERRVLARAWRDHPPVSQRLLDRLDPTVSSFIWWSLIPRNRRFQLSPDKTCKLDLPAESLRCEMEFPAGEFQVTSSGADKSPLQSSDSALRCELEIADSHTRRVLQRTGQWDDEGVEWELTGGSIQAISS